MDADSGCCPRSGRPGAHHELRVRNLELDRLMSGLPLDVGIPTAQQDEHRDAFAGRRAEHLERDLELGDASGRRAKTRFAC